MLHWGKAAAFSIAFTENLTARIEYLYLKLGNATCTSPTACGSDLGLPGGTSNPNDIAKFSTNIMGSASTTNSADLTWKFVDRRRALSDKHSG